MFKLRIVLVQPRNPLNIGAAARAMANFGFDDLAVVNAYEPVWRETVSAVGAEALVLKARNVNTLVEATKDCHLIVGTTTTRGRKLGRPVLRLPDLGKFLGKAGGKGTLRVALLFGPEKTGLSNKYLELCNDYVTIPTHSKTPSMNLSHAVAVCCYELAKKGLGVPAQDVMPASAQEREQVVRHAVQLFQAAEYLNETPAAQRAQKIREILLRWNLRQRDVRLMHGLMAHVIKKLNISA
ncbi:MAG: hypothetical protein A2901_08910 [Elusimicrobia bacterium RIFCSPLOWO2_01_FULL_54_10]|nr:MAG: hypothetical protein A2901_08910 [Elusimicrobia bacterium RIFCSPLOWO2_01_FULL_54_10]